MEFSEYNDAVRAMSKAFFYFFYLCQHDAESKGVGRDSKEFLAGAGFVESHPTSNILK